MSIKSLVIQSPIDANCDVLFFYVRSQATVCAIVLKIAHKRSI